MSKIRIYLAGTIYKDPPHNTWKPELMNYLSSDIYEFFDPDPSNEPEKYMVARDKAEISKCDIFVAYIAKVSIGTSMEVHYANSLNTKPVLVIDPLFRLENDLWLSYHCHKFCMTVFSCSEHIKSMRF